ncbi:hypothetical protein I3843_08G105100 [Carya illinoinensis]|nr:hypothetical protein I3843_08G105100 [Carya illinoinensis]
MESINEDNFVGRGGWRYLWIRYGRDEAGVRVKCRTLLPEKISPSLLELLAKSALHPLPQAILETRKKGVEIEALVHWQNLSPTEPTWENLAKLKTLFLLEDKEIFKEGRVVRDQE